MVSKFGCCVCILLYKPVPCSMYQFTVVTVFCFQNRLLRVNNKGNSVPAKLVAAGYLNFNSTTGKY